MADLDELAAKGRAKQAAQKSAAEKSRARAARKKKATTNMVLKRSLSGSSANGWFMVLGSAIVVPGSMAGGIALMAVNEVAAMACMAIGLFGGMGAVAAGGMWMASRTYTRQLTWLDRLPFAFDIDGYLGALSTGRGNTRCQVDLVFMEPVPDEARETLQAAARAVDGVKHADFRKDGRLRIRSDELQTWFVPGKNRKPYHSNAPVHRWFRAVADGPITAIHAHHPLERADFGVSG